METTGAAIDTSGAATGTTDRNGAATGNTHQTGGETGTTHPVLDPVAGTSEPVARPHAVSAPVVAPVFAPARLLEMAFEGAPGSTCVPHECLDGAALAALDPTLSDLSLLLGPASMAGARGGPATTLADASTSRPAPEAPASRAGSRLLGGGVSRFGAGFSLACLLSC
jgi:hypothetical protein